jgi:acid phosphatase (class B)
MHEFLRMLCRQLLLLAFVASAAGCCHRQCRCAGSRPSGQRLITTEGLRASLPAAPIVAGFDIDDTVLFSSPGFYYGMTNTDGPGGGNRFGASPLKNPQFWKELNQEYDKFSIPKEIGRTLVRMHSERGDRVVFITARICADEDRAVLERRLQALFKPAALTVVCTNETSKTGPIAESGVDIYYGDADTDMEYARGVTTKKVRPIRVQRSPLSTNRPALGYRPGDFGEEILVNSEN